MPIDLILPDGNGGGRAFGSVAERFLSQGLTVNALRTNDILRKEEWINFDEVVVQIARQRLRAVADLLGAGLVKNLPNAMGTTIVQWEDISDMDPAERSMDGLTRTVDDRVEFQLNSLPVYITHKDFSLNLRHLSASRNLGEPLDTTQVAVATRKVSEDLETALINGVGGYTVAGSTAYGYTTFPWRNTYEFAGNEAWDAAGKTGEEILQDVIGMIQVAHGDNMYGPYMLYVTTSYWVKLQEDFKANSDKTIMQRLQEIDGISGVRVLDFLTADNVILIQMSLDVVDEVVGFQPTLVQWEEQGGFKLNFKVMAIMIPRMKKDQEGRSGIVHGSTASGGG